MNWLVEKFEHIERIWPTLTREQKVKNVEWLQEQYLMFEERMTLKELAKCYNILLKFEDELFA